MFIYFRIYFIWIEIHLDKYMYIVQLHTQKIEMDVCINGLRQLDREKLISKKKYTKKKNYPTLFG